MLQIENLNETGLCYLIMDVAEMIDSHCLEEQKGPGLQMENCWITPEGCYWLFKLMQNARYNDATIARVRNMLKQGTNHPEML